MLWIGLQFSKKLPLSALLNLVFLFSVLPVLWSDGVLATVAQFWGSRKGGHFGKHVEIPLLKIVAFCQFEYRIACQ